ncbi:activating signal cointegrator complex subunit 3 [Paragonimus westermani]|uniref:DNA 3'-5' helicase n=1 Tax=Paragonimus westermani TaxID=34504 RepID=A0A5J4N6B7_9TREM|nr:activating signal cointegrator complex subunit 3 [Paragonimus westermani]
MVTSPFTSRERYHYRIAYILCTRFTSPQIFGRAGRPQFDTQGMASIITSIDKLDHYLRLITNQHPIESSLLSNLNDHLNAEIALGTVTNIDDAVTWLKDTYLFVRLLKNPLHYGIQADLSNSDSALSDYLGRVVRSSALDLDAAEMIRYEPQTGQLASTDRGRTASLFYIRFSTAAMVRDTLEPTTMLPQLFSVLSEASEFVAMKMIEQRQWDGQTPLWQFAGASSHRLLQRVDEMELSVDRIRETEIDELTHLLRFRGRDGAREVSQLAALVPRIQLTAETQPITRTILRVRMTLEPDFTWSDRSHGTQQNFWIWIEDPDQGLIYHSEYWTLTKRTQSSVTTQTPFVCVPVPAPSTFPATVLFFPDTQFKSKEPNHVVCTIPLFEPFPTQYLVRVSSDQWLGADTVYPLSFKRLLLPPPDPPHTNLLNLEPLPVSALQNSQYELLYKFTHFNPIQTQIFHTLYHQDVNVLLGAPTGSGKTVAAELAIFRVFNETPSKKVRSINQ